MSSGERLISRIPGEGLAPIRWDGGTTYEPGSAAAQLSKLNYEVDVTTAPYYCPTDGVANALPAMQFAANDVSARGGGVVWVPPVLYNMTAGQLSIPSNVALVGRADGPFDHSALPTTQVSAPTFLLGHASLSPFRFIGNGGKVANVAFYYPDQVAPTDATPTAYPATFLVDEGIAGSTVEKCTFINAYIGADIRSGRTTFVNNNMGCLYRDFVIDQAYDFITISNNKSEPFWDIYAGNLLFPQALDAWVMTNKINFETARVDSLNVTGHKIFGSYAMHLTRDSVDTGLANRSGYGSFIGCECDYIAYGVIARSARNSAKGYSYVGCGWKPNLSGSGVSGKSVVKVETGGTEPPVISLVGGTVQGSDAQWTEGKINNLAASAGATVSTASLAGYDADTMTRSHYRGTRALLKAQIVAAPELLRDESASVEAAIRAALITGQPLRLDGVFYVNTPINISVDGRRVDLQNHGDAWIIGGPALNAPVIKIANSATVGGTTARSVAIRVSGLQFDVRHAPYGVLNSVNCLNFSGFRDTIIDGCYFYHGEDYREGNAGGDAGLFTTSNRVVFKHNTVVGAPDLAVYSSGSQTGTQDNISLLSEGNNYIKCANAIAAKRNYRYVRSVGDHFDGCYNCITASPAGGTGDGQLCGSRVVATGATFRNIIAKCFDPRSSSNWHGSGVISGTFGIDLDGATVANAAFIGIAGSENCSFDIVGEVEGATDSTHAAVRITTHANSETGITSTSRGNTVRATVKNIYNGLLEFTPCEKNTVELNLSAVTNPVTMPTANLTRVTINNDGARSEITGNFDTTPNRAQFTGTIYTANSSLSLGAVGRTVQAQPAASAVQLALPTGAASGDNIDVMKIAGSGAGLVQIRNPANTTTLFNIADVGGTVQMRFNGTDWLPVERYVSDRVITLVQTPAASIATPPTAAKTLFIDSADGAVKVKDSAGATDTLVFQSYLGTAANATIGTSGATVPLLNTANTWDTAQTYRQSLTISNLTSSSILNISSIDGQQAYATFRTANVEMWRFGKNQTANTGSNAGSNFALIRYDDAGVSLGTSVFITRSNGDIFLGGKTQPATDNAHALGGASNRWTGVHTVRVYYSATVFDAFGAGSPEGALAAAVGSTYRRTDGAALTSFYVKETGTGNTGWVAK